MDTIYCYFNGKIIDVNSVNINPNDLGFLRGYGVFDVMRTFNKKPFLLDQHWERLFNSAKELNIKMPISKEGFAKILKKLLKKNNFIDASIKTIVTGGISENGIAMGNRPTILIAVNDIGIFVPDRKFFKEGAKVTTLEFKRFLPRAKTLNYIAVIREQSRKKKTNAQEIVYVNNKSVLEGATSNIFIIKNGKLITAIDEILMGTIRYFVINLAKENNLDIEERLVGVEELFSADEVFITGTYKWILPITSVNSKKIGNGEVGPITKKITKLADNFIKNE